MRRCFACWSAPLPLEGTVAIRAGIRVMVEQPLVRAL
jgi:hypothetical protein